MLEKWLPDSQYPRQGAGDGGKNLPNAERRPLCIVSGVRANSDFRLRRAYPSLVARSTRPEAVIAIHWARSRGPERNFVLLAALGASNRVCLPSAAAESATTTAKSAAAPVIRRPARPAAVQATLRLVSIALFQVILLIVDRKYKILAAVRTYKRPILKDQFDLLKEKSLPTECHRGIRSFFRSRQVLFSEQPAQL